MAKFFFYAAAAALCATVFGSAAVEVQTTTKPACVPLNFTEKATDIKSLNAVIDLAIQSGLLKTNIPSAITVTNSTVSVVPFSVLGLDFELTPIIKTLNVTGVQNILPKHLNVSSANSVIVAADINGTVTVDGTITLQIQQLNHKWYEICWTNILNPSTCPPATVDIDVDISIVKPSLSANTELNLVACAPGVATSVCKNVTVSDILIAALTSKFDTLLARLLKRFTSASVLDLGISFESITNLGVHFSTSGPLITKLGKQLLNFSVEEVNKKGSVYNAVIEILQKLFKSVLNNVISSSLAPQFGNTCYDA
jgi:hypothetical protein